MIGTDKRPRKLGLLKTVNVTAVINASYNYTAVATIFSSIITSFV